MPPRTRKGTQQTMAADTWDKLLDTATFEDRSRSDRRSIIDVPEKVLTFTKGLYESNQRANLPCKNREEFQDLKLMFQSAADKLGLSANVRPDEEQEDKTDEHGRTVKVLKIVGLTVSVGVRRGAKSKKNTEPATQVSSKAS